MLLHLYNPMLALPPTPPSAVSPGLGTVQGAGSARFGASMLQPGLHWPLQHRAIPVLSPARWAVPLQGQCLLREMHLGWNFSCVAPSLLPARGFTHSSNCWTLLWCSRCVRPEAVGTALVPAALPALVPAKRQCQPWFQLQDHPWLQLQCQPWFQQQCHGSTDHPG